MTTRWILPILALASLTVPTLRAVPEALGGAPSGALRGAPQVLPVGQASGSWNLPVPAAGSDGFAAGLLTLGAGQPFYLLDAWLPADSVQLVGGQLEGQLHGALASFPLSPVGQAFPLVSGTWRSDGEGGGSFTAVLHTGGGPQGVPTVVLGVLSGTFVDPLTPGGPDVLGSFAGTWALTPPHG